MIAALGILAPAQHRLPFEFRAHRVPKIGMDAAKSGASILSGLRARCDTLRSHLQG